MSTRTLLTAMPRADRKARTGTRRLVRMLVGEPWHKMRVYIQGWWWGGEGVASWVLDISQVSLIEFLDKLETGYKVEEADSKNLNLGEWNWYCLDLGGCEWSRSWGKARALLLPTFFQMQTLSWQLRIRSQTSEKSWKLGVGRTLVICTGMNLKVKKPTKVEDRSLTSLTNAGDYGDPGEGQNWPFYA